MVAQELSTPASTTTRTRNMAVQQSGRTSADAHTAWRRPLICAVSVAATLCCFFVPGAVSPMPPYFPADRGWHIIESGKYDSLENHPPTLLDNAPVLDKAFGIVREFYPEIDEVLKRDFLDTDAELAEPFELELTSKDVERYLGAVRPNLRENAAKCLWGIKKKDFHEMARAIIRHTDLNQRFKYKKSLNEFIREDDVKKEMKTKFRRGYVTASYEEQDHYSAKPSDVSDDLDTWVQASIKVMSGLHWEADSYEDFSNSVGIKLTLHPNVKPNEPEGSILYFLASYKIDKNGEIGEAIDECCGIKDVDYANFTGKPGEGAEAFAGFNRISEPNKNILDLKLEDSMFISKTNKREKPFSKEGKFVKGALGLAKMFHNDTKMSHYSETVNEVGKPTDSITRASLKVANEGRKEEYPRSDILSIKRKGPIGQRQFKSFEIERVYSFWNSDCLDEPFYKKPALSPSSEDKRQTGKYKAKLRIYQEYTIDDARNEMKINIGFVVDRWGFWNSISYPLCFDFERVVQLAPPGEKDKTIAVKQGLCYKTDEHKSIAHLSHLTQKGFKAGSFKYETGNLSSSINKVAFSEDRIGTTIPSMIPIKFLECKKEYEPQSNKLGRLDYLSEALSVNDCKGQKSSLLGTTLFDGGLLSFGIITAFVLLAATFESSRKGKKVRMTQSRVVDSSKNNIVEGQ